MRNQELRGPMERGVDLQAAFMKAELAKVERHLSATIAAHDHHDHHDRHPSDGSKGGCDQRLGVGWARALHAKVSTARRGLTALNAAPRGEELKSLLCDAFQLLTAHEVGHTLGLRHNFAGSSVVPFEQLSDKNARYTSSVMDYLPYK